MIIRNSKNKNKNKGDNNFMRDIQNTQCYNYIWADKNILSI